MCHWQQEAACVERLWAALQHATRNATQRHSRPDSTSSTGRMRNICTTHSVVVVARFRHAT